MLKTGLYLADFGAIQFVIFIPWVLAANPIGFALFERQFSAGMKPPPVYPRAVIGHPNPRNRFGVVDQGICFSAIAIIIAQNGAVDLAIDREPDLIIVLRQGGAGPRNHKRNWQKELHEGDLSNVKIGNETWQASRWEDLSKTALFMRSVKRFECAVFGARPKYNGPVGPT